MSRRVEPIELHECRQGEINTGLAWPLIVQHASGIDEARSRFSRVWIRINDAKGAYLLTWVPVRDRSVVEVVLFICSVYHRSLSYPVVGRKGWHLSQQGIRLWEIPAVWRNWGRSLWTRRPPTSTSTAPLLTINPTFLWNHARWYAKAGDTVQFSTISHHQFVARSRKYWALSGIRRSCERLGRGE